MNLVSLIIEYFSEKYYLLSNSFEHNLFLEFWNFYGSFLFLGLLNLFFLAYLYKFEIIRKRILPEKLYNLEEKLKQKIENISIKQYLLLSIIAIPLVKLLIIPFWLVILPSFLYIFIVLQKEAVAHIVKKFLNGVTWILVIPTYIIKRVSFILIVHLNLLVVFEINGLRNVGLAATTILGVQEAAKEVHIEPFLKFLKGEAVELKYTRENFQKYVKPEFLLQWGGE